MIAQVPRIHSMFRFQWEPAQDCHVLLYPEGMIQLNGSASEILQRVDGKASVGDIIQQLEQKFPAAEEIAEDVVEFFHQALSQNWVLMSDAEVDV